MDWWQTEPMRLLQTNLREIDILLDPEGYAQNTAELGANVALFNLGGIVANYPTRLPFHYRNPRREGHNRGAYPIAAPAVDPFYRPL